MSAGLPIEAGSPVKLFRPLLPLVIVALLIAGCGGGGGGAKLASGDVAVVDNQHITLDQFNTALAEQKATLKDAGQSVPAAGSTAFVSLRTNIVDLLVQQAEFALQAKALGISVTPAEVAKQLTALKKKYFSGSQKKYLAGIKAQGFTDAEVQSNLQEKLLEQKLYAHVTKDATATDAEVKAYYTVNITKYQTPESRKVEEILVGKNKQALAKTIYTQLKAGGSFAALAKKYSQDPGSKNIGGKFTANKGSDVPEFDAAVFAASAKTGQLLPPVETAQYGWFVIEPLSAITPAKTTPESKAAPAIRKQLNATKKQSAANDWLTKTEKGYCSGKIAYGTDYTPSPDPCTTLSTSNPTTT